MRTVENHTQSLANYLPNGRMFEAKNVYDSNFRMLLRGLAGELFTAEGYLDTLEQEFYPDTTTLFLSDWERALGIPDHCFTGTGTVIERRRAIIAKLTGMWVQTIDDFIALAAIFGITVVVNAGIDEITFPLVFPVYMFSTVQEARYTIVVRHQLSSSNVFPLVFPILFGTPELGIVECVFNKVKPSNCNVAFIEV